MVDTSATGRPFPGWEDVDEDIIPKTDDTYDLGSSTKKWAYLYAVIAILTSLTIGGIYLGATAEGYFLINASTQINGSLNVTGDEIFIAGIEVATLNDLVAGNVTVSSLINVKNTAGATANKGAAMTFKSYNSAIDRYNVIFANNTARHGHAHCVMTSSVADNGKGQCLVSGALETFDTSDWAEGSDLYLNVTPGTLTSTKPTSAECIQKLALVLRSHLTQGSIYVHGAGRCNDVPYNFSVLGNITASYFFGDGSLLLNLPTGDNSSWNETYADGLYADISVTGDNSSWNETYADGLYATLTEIFDFGYYNSTDFSISDYFTKSNILGFSYWNDTYATFNKTYADTLYSGITEPLWAGNYSAHNSTWTSTYNSTYDAKVSFPGWNANLTWINESNVFTASQNLTGQNITAIDCIIFDSGGKICSGT